MTGIRFKVAVILALILPVACSVPKPLFEATPSEVSAVEEVRFENMTENAESYLWDFGDGTTSTELSPVHKFMRSGNYAVTLKATGGKKTKETTKIMEVKAPRTCLVEMTTEYGTMVIQLFDDTPQHRDNFLKLAEEGFYDDLLFHRVINGFMIQGGDPESRDALPGSALGMGGPGYQVPAEFDPSHVHIKGAVAAARTGDQVNPERKSSGSQFYIVQGRPVPEVVLEQVEINNGIEYSPEQRRQYAEQGGTPQLDMTYTVFGQVIEGLDVIDKIATVRTDMRDRPEQDVRIKVEVIK